MTKLGSTIRAVVFDMDGVIIDSHSISRQLISECGQRHGVAFDDLDMQAWQGLSAGEFWDYAIQKYELDETSEFYQSDYPVDEEIRRYANLEPIAGVVHLLNELERYGMRLALATGGSRYRMKAVLDLFRLDAKFEVALSADDVARSKPDPEIYRLAAARLGLPTCECMVVEDSPQGIHAAVQAGTTCIGYSGLHHQQQNLALADLVVDDFRDLGYEKIRNFGVGR